MCMKRMCITVIVLLIVTTSIIQAQDQQPFIITVYGGLFFPAHFHYKEVYQSTSDLVYGFGIGLPVNRSLIVTGDMSFFKSEAILGQVVDSLAKLEEKFIHVGLLSKQPVTASLWIRLFGGFNYITITQSVTGPQSGEQSVDAEKKIGYFGGLGVEHLFDGGRTSLFGDVVYDYRRLHDTNFNGDYGGLRCVIGVNFILF
jgi:hypothetical protein